MSPSAAGWGFSLRQEDPQPPHIKEEEEDLWVTRGGECFPGQEVADLIKFPLTVVSVKSEYHEDKPPESSHLHHSPNNCEEYLLPEQQEWSLRMGKEEPQPSHIKEEEEDPQPSHIKEEEEEHSISQEGNHLEWSEDFPVIGVIVKSEDDEVKGESEEKREAEPPSSSSTQHMTTEADGDHCGGSQADKILAPLSDSDNTTSHSPDTDDEDSKDKTCHTDNTRFTCSHCDKMFKYCGNLKVHMKIHTGEKPFTCSECGKRFARKHVLKVHMRTHTGEKPFTCSICGKDYTQRQYLKVHMRTHTADKPFMCSVCSKIFSVKANLIMHTRIHTGEKPFICSECGKGFIQRQHLKRHMRIHTGEKV
ncbi:zinc finger protein 37-like [Nerophis ophidion]|uniref:zinc finger protein 37-like n=1 Tax=Nerophis ophidion TaxID=159077 RepID=UPI002ADF6678|nr:zinc finger protein 37-like [Nerophis ophidion]XP_061759038.1 zinc finger protein 37-like [Nerophis ophidion]XP_061759039.1 zinc finger protein 37-like [Nerophis ophidion]XP_061759040.1 zinc finger protein 37-like [Nerophis ophidion]XP_061759041.1 zinc finger protein 37-like [Nerophis ophidion]XP_061759042.1 zinc finger protein 37-like [Nerophis ophidion]XP_061759043.1 zinc finger protein 37-like [Nerophis ophidion]XP_061759045.1 zinc finger protein 37-like [Nerophis ophidion]XP_06175904